MPFTSKQQLAAALDNPFKFSIVRQLVSSFSASGSSRLSSFLQTTNPSLHPNTTFAALTSLSGGLDSSSPGAVPLPTPEAGKSWHLAEMQAVQHGEAFTVLYDRYCQSGPVTISTGGVAVPVTGCSLPARVADTSVGHQVWLEGNGAFTPTSAVTISYTNEAGVAGRIGTLPGATTIIGPAIPGICWGPFTLQAGDVAAHSVQSVTFTTAQTSTPSPTVHLVLARPIAGAAGATAREPQRYGWTELGLPDVGASPCLYLLMSTGASTVGFNTSLTFVEG